MSLKRPGTGTNVVELRPRFRIDDDLDAAYGFSTNHRRQIEASEVCGCFFCAAVFATGEIQEWVDDGQTAICPRCGVDSVIGSGSGVPIGHEFLVRMRKAWFSK
jgi:hypothetical protein